MARRLRLRVGVAASWLSQATVALSKGDYGAHRYYPHYICSYPTITVYELQYIVNKCARN
jgi:hypothetical protein